MKKYLLTLLLGLNCHTKELRKEVVVIDTGFNFVKDGIVPRIAFCEDGLIDLTGTGLFDSLGHGTNVIGLITDRLDLKQFCITSIKWYNNTMMTKQNINIINNRIYELLKNRRPYLINMSLEGPDYYQIEYDLLKEKLDNGTFVVVASGNRHLNLDKGCISFPACYNFNNKYFKVVASSPDNLNYSSFSNYGGPVNILENGEHWCKEGYCFSGTSQATAVVSNKILRGLIK